MGLACGALQRCIEKEGSIIASPLATDISILVEQHLHFVLFVELVQCVLGILPSCHVAMRLVEKL